MGFKDLFKSAKERERDRRRAKRHQERNIERVIDKMGDRIKAQEKERAKLWEKAKELLQSGKKLEAKRLLERYKGMEVLINRLEKQRMLWQSKLNTIATAGDANEISAALADFGDMLNIDPDKIVDDLERVDDVEGDIKDVNSIIDKEYEKDNAKIAEESEAQSEVSVDDDLMSALESEAAADVLGGKVSDATKSADDINAGRDRLRVLLNEK